MSAYEFTPQEQDVIRELGRLGFRYARETKKAVEFQNDATGQVIELNREHSGFALVFGFGDPSRLSGAPGILKIGPRASSNFRGLGKGLTRNLRANHQGLQVVIEGVDVIKSVLGALS